MNANAKTPIAEITPPGFMNDHASGVGGLKSQRDNYKIYLYANEDTKH